MLFPLSNGCVPRWQLSNFLWTPKEGTPTWSAVKNFKQLTCAQTSICWILTYMVMTSRLEYPWGKGINRYALSNNTLPKLKPLNRDNSTWLAWSSCHLPLFTTSCWSEGFFLCNYLLPCTKMETYMLRWSPWWKEKGSCVTVRSKGNKES